MSGVGIGFVDRLFLVITCLELQLFCNVVHQAYNLGMLHLRIHPSVCYICLMCIVFACVSDDLY